MASTVTVVHGFNKIPVKVTPNTLLSQVLGEACKKLRIDPGTAALHHNRKTLDPGLSVRFANLPAGAKLELKASTGVSSSAKKANVFLQLPNGQRLNVGEFTGANTFNDILVKAEADLGSSDADALTGLRQRAGVTDASLQPSLQPVTVNQQVAGAGIKDTTLGSLNLSGRVLVRLTFVAGSQPTPTPAPAAATPAATPAADTAAPSSAAQPAAQSSADLTSLHQEEAKAEELRARQRAAAEARTEAGRAQNGVGARPVSLASGSGNQAGGSVMPPAKKQVIAPVNRGPCPRDIRLFNPPLPGESMSSKIDLPPDFFELSREDLQAINNLVKRRNDESSTLMTKYMRNLKEQERRARYPKSLIRLRFPDQVQVQAAFWGTEKVEAIIELINSILGESSPGYYLFTTPPVQRIKDPAKSLWAADLAPASVVHVGWGDGDASRSTIPLLRAEYANRLEPLPPPSTAPTQQQASGAGSSGGQVLGNTPTPASASSGATGTAASAGGNRNGQSSMSRTDKDKKLKGFIRL